MKRTRNSSGFTLLELLFTLLILAILAAIAMPALGIWIDSSRSNATRQQLQSFISRARSHALNGAQIVTICHLSDTGSCSSNLEFPITQFVDTDRDAAQGGDEIALGVLEMELPDNVQLSWNREDGYLRFWPSGGTGALTGSLSYCDQHDDQYDFRVVIARTGRTRIDFDETRCD